MITERDLKEAIAECQGVRNPDANTCIKLAAFLTIQREMFGEEIPTRSFTYAPATGQIDYDSDTEFARLIKGKNPDDVWSVIDELMTTLDAVHPRLYDAVIRELS